MNAIPVDTLPPISSGADGPAATRPTLPAPVVEIDGDWDAAAMLNALPERVNRYRVADLAITYCNAAWASQYGVDPADAIGQPLDEFLSPTRSRACIRSSALLGPDNPILVDHVARAAHRTPRASGWSGSTATSIGPTGPEVLSVGRDVTERHIAEQQARRERSPLPRPRRQVVRHRVAHRRRPDTALRLHQPVGREHPRLPAGVLPRRLQPRARHPRRQRAAGDRLALRGERAAEPDGLPPPSRRRLDRDRRDPDDSGAAMRSRASPAT